MKIQYELVYEVWDSHLNINAPKFNSLQSLYFDELLGDFFCPADFYYYVLDFPRKRFDVVSHHVLDIFGFAPEEYKLENLLERIHPEDIEFVTQCERLVADFIHNKILPEQVIKYKINYCFRLKTKNDQYKMYLHQALPLNAGENGGFDKVLGIHSDVSHIILQNNYKISFIGLEGEPSVLEKDVFPGNMFKNSYQASPFTRRELEILKYFSEGCTAREIADHLNISEETVNTHRKNMIAKVQLKNTTELVAFCVRKGYI